MHACVCSYLEMIASVFPLCQSLFWYWTANLWRAWKCIKCCLLRTQIRYFNCIPSLSFACTQFKNKVGLLRLFINIVFQETAWCFFVLSLFLSHVKLGIHCVSISVDTHMWHILHHGAKTHKALCRVFLKRRKLEQLEFKWKYGKGSETQVKP